ncbi:hypothetical protein EX30DRAFT_344069 [Ascodesmis nigricans]|uniref:Uncharacterized protein n=1 Tax=Ascodesmis nigricans TaxID=341454 RepID=A0A4S2MKE5_9PEZI|nr:hypothetical protein EX30DRAFT_344069 [Ascodesmis nigricans]
MFVILLSTSSTSIPSQSPLTLHLATASLTTPFSRPDAAAQSSPNTSTAEWAESTSTSSTSVVNMNYPSRCPTAPTVLTAHSACGGSSFHHTSITISVNTATTRSVRTVMGRLMLRWKIVHEIPDWLHWLKCRNSGAGNVASVAV